MSGQGLLIAWLVGALCGAAMVRHRLYLAVVSVYMMALGSMHFAGVAADGVAIELLTTLLFVIVAFGIVLGAMAFWQGKERT